MVFPLCQWIERNINRIIQIVLDLDKNGRSSSLIDTFQQNFPKLK